MPTFGAWPDNRAGAVELAQGTGAQYEIYQFGQWYPTIQSRSAAGEISEREGYSDEIKLS